MGFLLMLMPPYAGATPVTWQLQDVVIGIGIVDVPTALTGTFVYDADLNQYSNVDITSQAGAGWVCQQPVTTTPCLPDTRSMAGEHYNYAFGSSTVLYAHNSSHYTGTLVDLPILVMSFSSSLTNAGGSIGTNGEEVVCLYENCTYDGRTAVSRAFVSYDIYDASHTVLLLKGTSRVVSVNVPEPGTLALLGIGILAIGSLRQRRLPNKRR